MLMKVIIANLKITYLNSKPNHLEENGLKAYQLTINKVSHRMCRYTARCRYITRSCIWKGTHYRDVTMSTLASQITSVSIVYPIVRSGKDQRKHQSSASLAFVRGNSPVTGEFLAQRVSNAENISIWWRHRETRIISWKMILTFKG